MTPMSQWNLVELRATLNVEGVAQRPFDKYEIAEWHLACAADLPGSEGLDIERSLAQIDNYTEIVRALTQANYWKFCGSPGSYHHSEPYFCVLHLVTVLWEICGLQYHPEWYDLTPESSRTKVSFLTDSRDAFLHGILDCSGGTCGSIPLLVVAIGRRLDYPLYVVKAMNHLLVRWSDPQGRWRGIFGQSPCLPTHFNIEATNHGLTIPADDEYLIWPKPIAPHLVRNGTYLACLSPPEEVSESLMARSVCLRRHKRWGEAVAALRRAVELAPHNALRVAHLEQVERMVRRRWPAFSHPPRGMTDARNTSRTRHIGKSRPD